MNLLQWYLQLGQFLYDRNKAVAAYGFRQVLCCRTRTGIGDFYPPPLLIYDRMMSYIRPFELVYLVLPDVNIILIVEPHTEVLVVGVDLAVALVDSQRPVIQAAAAYVSRMSFAPPCGLLNGWEDYQAAIIMQTYDLALRFASMQMGVL